MRRYIQTHSFLYHNTTIDLIWFVTLHWTRLQCNHTWLQCGRGEGGPLDGPPECRYVENVSPLHRVLWPSLSALRCGARVHVHRYRYTRVDGTWNFIIFQSWIAAPKQVICHCRLSFIEYMEVFVSMVHKIRDKKEWCINASSVT